jgi:Spy/CpxP family protein refolding chaperone
MKNTTSMLSALALAAVVACTAGAQSAERNGRPDRAQGAQQDSAGRRGPRGPERMLLRGITLSADQQTKLADLQRRDREARDANRPRRAEGRNVPNGTADRPRREPGDTTGMAARRADMERRFEQRIAAIREILTPAQRTQFDKNVAEAKANRPQGDGRFGGPRRGR